jgi:hypothetical protein
MRTPQASQIGESRAGVEARESARNVAAAAPAVGAHVGIVRQR